METPDSTLYVDRDGRLIRFHAYRNGDRAGLVTARYEGSAHRLFMGDWDEITRYAGSQDWKHISTDTAKARLAS